MRNEKGKGDMRISNIEYIMLNVEVEDPNKILELCFPCQLVNLSTC